MEIGTDVAREGYLAIPDAGTGPGVYARTASFDHIILGNVFALEDAKQPAIVLATPDCVGVEVVDNVVLGGKGHLVEGQAQPAVERGNRLGPAREDPDLPRPPVPSIFAWQRQTVSP